MKKRPAGFPPFFSSNKPRKCFLNQKKNNNNFHSIFFFFFSKIIFYFSFSRRCCINDLDGQVRTKGFTTAWRSKDKLLPIPAEELSFREMFPFESQVILTNFFFFGKNFHFIPAARTNEKKKNNMGFTGAPLAVASGTSVAMRSFASLSLSTQPSFIDVTLISNSF